MGSRLVCSVEITNAWISDSFELLGELNLHMFMSVDNPFGGCSSNAFVCELARLSDAS